MRKIICGTIIVLFAMACSNNRENGFSQEEKKVIGKVEDGIMRVLLVTDEKDSIFLHQETLTTGKSRTGIRNIPCLTGTDVRNRE